MDAIARNSATASGTWIPPMPPEPDVSASLCHQLPNYRLNPGVRLAKSGAYLVL